MKKKKEIRALPEERETVFALTILFEFVCGILLLVFPDKSLVIANTALGILFVVLGIINIITYFTSGTIKQISGLTLSKGLVALFIALLPVILPNAISEIMAIAWGGLIILGGMIKAQLSVDMKQIHEANWWVPLIGTGISLLLGILIILKPEFLNSIAIVFIGISLLVEAVQDLVFLLIAGRRVQNYRRQHAVSNPTSDSVTPQSESQISTDSDDENMNREI